MPIIGINVIGIHAHISIHAHIGIYYIGILCLYTYLGINALIGIHAYMFIYYIGISFMPIGILPI